MVSRGTPQNELRTDLGEKRFNYEKKKSAGEEPTSSQPGGFTWMELGPRNAFCPPLTILGLKLLYHWKSPLKPAKLCVIRRPP